MAKQPKKKVKGGQWPGMNNTKANKERRGLKRARRLARAKAKRENKSHAILSASLETLS